MTAFAVNPGYSATVMLIGADCEPVLVVDDVLSDPEAVINWAETGADFRKDDKDFYPGVRSPFSMDYAASINLALRDLLIDTFGAPPHALIDPLSCLLSMATTRPDDLRPIQSVPHFDSYDGTQIAGVHYFCAPEFGGTSFYRHRSTGYESMNAQRIAQYAPRLKAEVIAQNSRRFKYIRGDTALFERTGSVEAKFNRAVYYRSNILHSGDIPATIDASSDPRAARLTANTLAAIRQS